MVPSPLDVRQVFLRLSHRTFMLTFRATQIIQGRLSIVKILN